MYVCTSFPCQIKGKDVRAAELPFKRGAIELLLLKTVSWRPMHGYAIAQWIQDTTDNALKVEEGSLYPALHRLENKGLIESAVGHLREQSAGQVLHAHTGRATDTPSRRE